MRYPINNYASAFTEAVRTAPQEKALKGLMKLLKRTGDIKYSDKILEAIHKKIVAENGGKWAMIETARTAGGLERIENEFSEKDRIDFKINPELAAGTRITINGEEELDNTLRNKLNKLFK